MKRTVFYPKEVVALPRGKASYDLLATVIDQIGSVVMYRDHDSRELKIIHSSKLRKTTQLADGTYKRIPNKRRKHAKRVGNRFVY